MRNNKNNILFNNDFYILLLLINLCCENLSLDGLKISEGVHLFRLYASVMCIYRKKKTLVT